MSGEQYGGEVSVWTGGCIKVGKLHCARISMRKLKACECGSTRDRHQPPIMNLSNRSKGQVVRRVCEALEAEYGRPRHGNPKNALDDLVYVILSNKTGPDMARRTHVQLKRQFQTWDDVLKGRASTFERILRPAGLSRVKSKQIRSTLGRLKSDFGSCSLQGLARLSTDEAQSYLTALPGVSDKVAKCVLMYTLRAQVLPVDAHVHRIATRVGWTVKKRADQCHPELQALVPPHRRYAFHVDCVAHGRLVCRPANPDCENCCINKYCVYNAEHV